jgi:hypothetical protein
MSGAAANANGVMYVMYCALEQDSRCLIVLCYFVPVSSDVLYSHEEFSSLFNVL